jgi:hypothetical protein
MSSILLILRTPRAMVAEGYLPVLSAVSRGASSLRDLWVRLNVNIDDHSRHRPFKAHYVCSTHSGAVLRQAKFKVFRNDDDHRVAAEFAHEHRAVFLVDAKHESGQAALRGFSTSS